MSWKKITHSGPGIAEHTHHLRGRECDSCKKDQWPDGSPMYPNGCRYDNPDEKAETLASETSCPTCGLIKPAEQIPACESCGGTGWFEGTPDGRGGTYTGHCEECWGTGKDNNFMRMNVPNVGLEDGEYYQRSRYTPVCDHHGLYSPSGEVQCGLCKAILDFATKTRLDFSRGRKMLERFHARFHPHPKTGKVNSADDVYGLNPDF